MLLLKHKKPPPSKQNPSHAGTLVAKPRTTRVRHITGFDAVPAHFDARIKWPFLDDGYIIQQAPCNMCYMIASMEMIRARLNVANGANNTPPLSLQYLLDHFPRNGSKGCSEGYSEAVVEWINGTSASTASASASPVKHPPPRIQFGMVEPSQFTRHGLQL